MFKRDTIKTFFFVLVVTVTIIAGILLVYSLTVSHEQVDTEPAVPEAPYIVPEPEPPSEEETVVAPPPPPVILPHLQELHEQNPDLAGWIRIPGTAVDYPVMRSPETDWDFYLHHNFEREEAFEGIPYIWPHHETADDDLVFIFAHNMADGSMFADVAKYTDSSFLEQHPVIELSSLYTERNFEIISVFKVWVDEEAEEQWYYHPQRGTDERIDFPYGFMTGWESADQFYEFLALSERNALHSTGAKAAYGERMIALWTCASASPDEMRLVVTAVER